MPERGSLTRCISQAITCFRNGYSDTVVITGNTRAKYYTFMFRAEFDGKLLADPTYRPRIVLNCTGGELAAIIGVGQDQLSFDFTTNETSTEGEERYTQASILNNGEPNGPTETLEERKQPRTYNPEANGDEVQTD